jgi:hypothetical protein
MQNLTDSDHNESLNKACLGDMDRILKSCMEILYLKCLLGQLPSTTVMEKKWTLHVFISDHCEYDFVTVW